MGRRVCFLGLASSSAELSQIGELGERGQGNMEVWLVNEANHVLPLGWQATRAFQLHVRDWREPDRSFVYSNGKRLPPGMNRNCFGRNLKYVRYLQTCGVPVYAQQLWDDIPTSVVFPFEEARRAVGIPLPPSGEKRLWATSSFGYMAALLLMEHLWGETVEELLLYGVELPLGTNRERIWEWPNLAYYLGLATGLGIKITLPQSGTSLLSAPHYALGGRPFPQDADHWFAPGYAGIIADGDVIRLGTYIPTYEVL